MEHLNKPTEKAESLTGSVGKPSAPQNAPQGTEPVIATGGTLSERADKVAKELVENLNRNVTAEGILDEMARRQCAVAPVFPLYERHAPEFSWQSATEQFKMRFTHAYESPDREQDFDAFVKAFVDQWPDGLGALRITPEWKGHLAQEPYTKDGLWPAFVHIQP